VEKDARPGSDRKFENESVNQVGSRGITGMILATSKKKGKEMEVGGRLPTKKHGNYLRLDLSQRRRSATSQNRGLFLS